MQASLAAPATVELDSQVLLDTNLTVGPADAVIAHRGARQSYLLSPYCAAQEGGAAAWQPLLTDTADATVLSISLKG